MSCSLQIFGAFISESWKKQNLYYGNGLTFVFSAGTGSGSSSGGSFSVHKWSESNSYFVLSKDKFLAIGGGDHFAIWLDQNFRDGSSMSCVTFNSPPLASTQEFKVFNVECWGFI